MLIDYVPYLLRQEMLHFSSKDYQQVQQHQQSLDRNAIQLAKETVE